MLAGCSFSSSRHLDEHRGSIDPFAETVQAAGSGDGEEAEEEKIFLVPSAAAFPYGMSTAAGPSLAVAKKEEFSKSPSNSPASSDGTDGGSSAAVPRPEQLHAPRRGEFPTVAFLSSVLLPRYATAYAAVDSGIVFTSRCPSIHFYCCCCS